MRTYGFTLLEVLAVLLLTSLVIGVALNHYIDLTRASERALNSTRNIRHAAALLDRVSRDIEGTVLVRKAPDVDPLTHPWIFYGESLRETEGADHLKFMTRGRRPRDSDAKESDQEVVVYALRHSEEDEDQFQLMRWTSPRIGDELDRNLPANEIDGAMLLSGGIADFGVTFIDETGQRTDRWDSSQIAQSGTLPAAAEIRVAMFDPSLSGDLEPTLYSRTVILPVRPLDFEELLDPMSLVSGGTGDLGKALEEVEGEGVSEALAQCMTNPCSTMTACQAIRCKDKVGTISPSIDELLLLAIKEQPAFCQWRINQPTRLLYLVDNPACR